MKDTEMYAMLLGLGAGWRVREVRLDMEKKRVDLWVETCEGGEWKCVECKEVSALYDHGVACGCADRHPVPRQSDAR